MKNHRNVPPEVKLPEECEEFFAQKQSESGAFVCCRGFDVVAAEVSLDEAVHVRGADPVLSRVPHSGQNEAEGGDLPPQSAQV